MSAAAVLTIRRDGQLLKELPIEGEAVVGRGPDCAVRLEDRAVSRRHAVLKLVDQGVQIEKKSEFGPLSVNGTDCTSAILKNGDQLEVGPFVLELKWDASPSVEAATITLAEPPTGIMPEPALDSIVEPSPAPPVGELPLEMPEPLPGILNEGFDGAVGPVSEPEAEAPAEILDGIHLDPPEPAAGDFSPSEPFSTDPIEIPNDGATQIFSQPTVQAKLIIGPGLANGEEFEVGDSEILIGRGKECHIQISDKKSSRKHLSIRKEGAAYWMKDLDSANGTSVNRVRTREKALSGGDVIRIGDTEIRFDALNTDYEKNKTQFLNVPDSEENFTEEAEQPAPELPLDPVPPPAAPDVAAFMQDPLPAPEKQGLWEKWKALPPRTRLIRGLSAIILIYMALDYLPMGNQKSAPKQKSKSAATQTSKENSPSDRTFESLSPEQKKFVEAQHELAFEHYRNKEYDKAIFEIQKIFQLVPDFKDSREIERYAKEGKRKLEAQEEERKRAEEEAKVKTKVAQYIQEARKRMDTANYPEAMQIFAQILALDPENETVAKWQQRIAEVEEQKRIDEEKRRVQGDLDGSARKILTRAEGLKKDNRCVEALAEYRKVGGTGTVNKKILIQVEGGMQECLVTIQTTLGPLLADTKQAETDGATAKAYKAYEKVLEMDPENTEALQAMGRIQDQIHEQAKYAYTEAVVAESYSDFETARKKYQHCMEISPKGDVYYERAKRRLSRFLPLEQAEGTNP